jgi:hypothetical protein
MHPPIVIDTDAFYDDRSLMDLLGVSELALTKARQSGTLKYTRKGQRILYRGAWVVAWLSLESTREPAAPRTREAAHASR